MKKIATLLAFTAAGMGSVFADIPGNNNPQPVPEAVSTFGVLSLALAVMVAVRHLVRK